MARAPVLPARGISDALQFEEDNVHACVQTNERVRHYSRTLFQHTIQGTRALTSHGR